MQKIISKYFDIKSDIFVIVGINPIKIQLYINAAIV